MYFYMYQDSAGAWRWTLFSSEGRSITKSGKGFNEELACVCDIELVVPREQNPQVYKVAIAGGAARVSSLPSLH